MNEYLHAFSPCIYTILMGCFHTVTQELQQHRIYSQNNDSVTCPVASPHMWLQLYGHGHKRTHSNMVQ